MGIRRTKLRHFIINFPWLENMNKDVKLIHSHQDQIIDLPEGATLVASNNYVPNAMYYIEIILCLYKDIQNLQMSMLMMWYVKEVISLEKKI